MPGEQRTCACEAELDFQICVECSDGGGYMELIPKCCNMTKKLVKARGKGKGGQLELYEERSPGHVCLRTKLAPIREYFYEHPRDCDWVAGKPLTAPRPGSRSPPKGKGAKRPATSPDVLGGAPSSSSSIGGGGGASKVLSALSGSPSRGGLGILQPLSPTVGLACVDGI